MCVCYNPCDTCHPPEEGNEIQTNIPLPPPLLGLSMFYWCWVKVQTDVKRFVLITLFLYYLPNTILTLTSLAIVTWGLNILIRYSGATGSTRRQIVRQNSVFVLVFGIETLLRTTMWGAGLATAETRDGSPNFVSGTSLGLAVVFALIHSCRGTLDLLVWWFTFSIGIKDAKELCAHVAERFRGRKDGSVSIRRPLLAPASSDSVVNHSLRRDVVYCFTFGILHSIREEEVAKRHKTFVGSVRDDFVGQVMVQWDSNNRDQEIEDRHQDPEYVEEEEQKIRFPPSASYRSFTFIDIKPKLFALLRKVFGVSAESYKESFKIENVADVESSGMLEKFTEGKSGSFFYFTRDYRYIIKTITHSEENFLKKFLFSYYEHMKANPNSIIVHFYGLHKVRLAPGQKYISVIVMNNIFHNEVGLSIHERYDLKGSRVGRSVLKGKETKERKVGTLKDLDLNKPVVIGPNNKEQLMDQLRQDLEFLRHHNIMDYSLLLGVHHHGDADSTRETGVQLSKGATPFSDIDMELEGSGRPLRNPREDHSSFIGGGEGNVVSRSNSMQSNGRDPRSHRTVDLPFFRRDYGGLRSYSPHHPLFVSEATQRYVTCIPSEGYKGIGTNELPIDTYYFVVVDILQEYNASKKVEHHFKTKVLRQSGLWISAVNPTYYAQRFLEAMDRIFD